MSKIESAKQILDIVYAELDKEALSEGVPKSFIFSIKYQEIKKEAKRRVLNNLDIAEKDFDNYFSEETQDTIQYLNSTKLQRRSKHTAELFDDLETDIEEMKNPPNIDRNKTKKIWQGFFKNLPKIK